MAVIESKIDRNGAEFRANCEMMQKAVDEFRAIEQKVVAKANEQAPKFHKRGQILPHERVNLLLDPGMPFLEISSLAGHLMHDDKDGTEAGGGTIAGIGYVSGVRCLVAASNSAIKGGTVTPAGLHKSLRLQAIARENKLPMVSLSESGSANLNYAGEIFVEGARGFVEPYLIQCGYLQRTPRGRLLTSHAFRHLGLAEPSRDPAQFGLFGNESDD